MSVIIAVKHEDIPYLAFDSRANSGEKYFTYDLKDSKCFSRLLGGNFLYFGFVGQHKLNNIVRNIFLPNLYLKDVRTWLTTLSIRIAAEHVFDSYFAVVDNNIYKCWNDHSNVIVVEPAAIGSGGYLALGAFSALKDDSSMTLKQKIRKSLEIAANHDSNCGVPFYLLNCQTGEVELLNESI